MHMLQMMVEQTALQQQNTEKQRKAKTLDVASTNSAISTIAENIWVLTTGCRMNLILQCQAEGFRLICLKIMAPGSEATIPLWNFRGCCSKRLINPSCTCSGSSHGGNTLTVASVGLGCAASRRVREPRCFTDSR